MRDLEIGPVVLGAMTFGSQVDVAEAERMVGLAREGGVRMFDTSNNYNAGASEEILGRVVRPFRDDILLSSKVGSTVGQEDTTVVGLGRKAIIRAVEDTLRRLGTDYLDLYYFHRPDRETPIAESLEAAAELVASGKVRALGQSNFAAWQVTELHHVAHAHAWPSVDVSQIMYNLLARRVEVEYAACSAHLRMFDIAYNPLAGGLLSGKHRPWSTPEAGTRFSKEMYRSRYWNDTQFEAVERLRVIARATGLTLLELSFRWLRDRPLTDAILVGASSAEQLRSNLAALQGPALDDDTLRACDLVWDQLSGIAPHYNR
ncbi:aldo/keto reductase [Actinopolymorpha pittospori]|uniref:Aryl-alcohol dehydrogenase-like predicted oxidoreductase n=1 Tax=Actinopolymorpha pittospori TaxID=648752 RepID=A0A927RDL2_9ACTN|nr:aldo/keto reductase [Actinopolymorpha pittospori]MBE1608265.1 aryl-alcohol dehydrogenase-like predicted oxidoreductase [Actinopolymorpha pittospori]